MNKTTEYIVFVILFVLVFGFISYNIYTNTSNLGCKITKPDEIESINDRIMQFGTQSNKPTCFDYCKKEVMCGTFGDTGFTDKHCLSLC